MNRFENLPQQNFAFTSDAVKFMQDAYSAFTQLAKLAGPNCVLSGCVHENGKITPGWMVFDSELLYFPGMACEGTVMGLLWQKKVITETVNVDGASRTQTIEQARLADLDEFRDPETGYYNVPDNAIYYNDRHIPWLEGWGLAKLDGIECYRQSLGVRNMSNANLLKTIFENFNIDEVVGVSVVISDDRGYRFFAGCPGQFVAAGTLKIPDVGVVASAYDTAGNGVAVYLYPDPAGDLPFIHNFGDFPSFEDSLELNPPVMQGNNTRRMLAGVAFPAAQTGNYPCCPR